MCTHNVTSYLYFYLLVHLHNTHIQHVEEDAVADCIKNISKESSDHLRPDNTLQIKKTNKHGLSLDSNSSSPAVVVFL